MPELTTSGYGLTVVPAIKDFNIFKPGETYNGSFTIKNETSKQISIDLELYDIDQDAKGLPIISENSPKTFSMKEWISLCCNEATLNPGEKKEIKYSINVPASEPPGGKYTVIIAKLKTEKSKKGVGLSEGIGHIIIGASPKKAVRNSKIDYFKVLNKVNFKCPSNPTRFELKVDNLGNIHERISGTVFIYKNKPTNTVATFSANQAKQIVLPEKSRVFNYQWKAKKLIDFDNNKLSVNLDALSIGKYNALLRVKHYENNKMVTEEQIVSFWLLPWWIIFIILALLAIIVKIINGLRK